jgi:hypothetical protein
MTTIDAFFDELDALPDAQLAGVFPIVVLMFAQKMNGVPPQLQPTIDRLVSELGWRDGDDDEAKAKSLDAYLAKHNVDSSVWRKLVMSLQKDPSALRDMARRLSGAPATTGALERKAPPPEGTVGAGPFARFAASKLK